MSSSRTINHGDLLKFACKNAEQQELYDALKYSSGNNYVFGTGPAGSGKSYVAAYSLLRDLVNDRFDKLYIARSVRPIKGESLGFDPGSSDDKLSDWLVPAVSNINKFLGQDYRKTDLRDRIEFVSLAKVRGMSIEHSGFLIEESQNLTLDLLKAILTRIDSNSLGVFVGDFEQKDTSRNDFYDVANALDTMDRFDWIELVESVRNPLIHDILTRIKPLEEAQQEYEKQWQLKRSHKY